MNFCCYWLVLGYKYKMFNYLYIMIENIFLVEFVDVEVVVVCI